MSTPYSPDNIRAAVIAAEDELIPLVGPDWPALEARYRELREQLADEDAKYLASVEVMELFAPYEAARERLDQAVIEQDLHSSVMLRLAGIAQQIDVDPATLAEAAQPTSPTRSVILKSPTKAKSIKLGNVDFDFGELTELCAGILMTGNEAVGDLGAKHYVLVAAGVLLIARSLLKAMTFELSEREATVFYGFTQAVGEDRKAAETAIREKANAARDSIGLEPLDEAAVRNALHRLQELKSVEPVEAQAGTWRIIEKYHVKG